MNNVFTRLATLTVYSPSQNIVVGDQLINNLLPGKYEVMKNISHSEDGVIEGSLIMIHEEFIKKRIGLQWQNAGKFTPQNQVIVIKEIEGPFSISRAKEKLLEDIAVHMESTVFASVKPSLQSGVYQTVEYDGHIQGIKIENLGTITPPEYLLQKACEKGDFAAFKKLINHKDPSKKAVPTNENFYLACMKGNKNIIKYLLTSPNVPNIFCINNKLNKSAFNIFCVSHSKKVEKLISELPDKQFKDIQKFISVPEHAVVRKAQLENAIKARVAKELSDELNQALPVNNIKIKKAKI